MQEKCFLFSSVAFKFEKVSKWANVNGEKGNLNRSCHLFDKWEKVILRNRFVPSTSVKRGDQKWDHRKVNHQSRLVRLIWLKSIDSLCLFICFTGKNRDRNEDQPKETHKSQDAQATLVKSQTTEPLKMPTEQTFTCNRCGMIFPSDEMLFKHKAQYCVGGRDPVYANDTHFSRNDRSTYPNGSADRSSAAKVRRKQSERREKEKKNQKASL